MATPNQGVQKGQQLETQQGQRQPSPTQAGQPPELARRQESSPYRWGAGLPVSPFGLMRRMMEDMDRMFEEFGMGRALEPAGLLQRSTGSLWSPQLEVFERGGNLVVRADLPGMKQEDIRVEVRNNALVLEGERNSEHQEEQGGVWRSERSYGTFRRTVALPEGVDPDQASARFENGVLEVSFKLPEQQSKRIEVKVKSSAEEQNAPEGKSTGAVH